MVEHTHETPEGAPEAQADVTQHIQGITTTNRHALFQATSTGLEALQAQPEARTARYAEWWRGVQTLRAQDVSRDGLIDRTLQQWIAQVRAGTRGKNPGQRAQLLALFTQWSGELSGDPPPFEERPRTSFTERRPS